MLKLKQYSRRSLLQTTWALAISFIILLTAANALLHDSGFKYALLAIILLFPFIGLVLGVAVFRREERVTLSLKFLPLFAGLFFNLILAALVVFGIIKGVSKPELPPRAQQPPSVAIPFTAQSFVQVANENFKPPKELKPGWWIERMTANKNQVVTDVRNRANIAKKLKLKDVKALSNPQAACVGAQSFLQAGVVFTYRYFDKQNKELYKFDINDAFCKKNKFY